MSNTTKPIGRLTIPVRSIRRPVRLSARPVDIMTAPPPRQLPALPDSIRGRIAIEVRAELDLMTARLPKFAPVAVPESGLCHKPIAETFQGHVLEYWCIKTPGHDGGCSPEKPTQAAAEVLELLPLDHHDAHGCLDAPEVAP